MPEVEATTPSRRFDDGHYSAWTCSVLVDGHTWAAVFAPSFAELERRRDTLLAAWREPAS